MRAPPLVLLALAFALLPAPGPAGADARSPAAPENGTHPHPTLPPPGGGADGDGRAGGGAACAALLARHDALPPAPGGTGADRAAFAAFYAARACRPAWTRDGAPLPAARELLAAVEGAGRDGLLPGDYRAAQAAAAAARGGDVEGLEALLTDAFLRYARHLTAGRVDPATLGPEWNVAARDRDLVLLLRSALEGGHMAQTLADLAPPTPAYRGLREALATLRAAAARGGWPAMPPGPTLRRGERGPRVAALRARLAWGASPAPPAPADADLFDEALEESVRAFQERHGLEPDGVAGKRTLRALAVTAAMRARQVAANLERLRWLPRDLGPRRVVVNIADFSLEVFEGGRPVLAMRVIAGREARRTPFFAGEITGVVVNPSWTVPLTIALEDKLPLILEDRDWLAEQGIAVYRRANGGWCETGPGEVDWVTLGEGNFPYKLVQRPGPTNALGRLKFQIPNPHDIYLHDTPSRGLFARSERTFSSGCIRVERPRELAELLLRPDPAWGADGIAAAIDAGATRTVPIPRPMPVYLLYWTAWTDAAGTLQLREDVYGQDGPLVAALGIAEDP